ncbi:MAG: hypothetical protein KKD44_20320 [Proteobacteria bacterium]|nr:hypothetical protein [Pseudomonadota bacterium]
MNKITHKLAILIATLFLFAAQAPAMDMSHDGDAIHTGKVDGYTMDYRMMDMRENMKKMGHMEGMDMKATHHLMVTVKGPNGPVKGQAGYMVTGPDGKTQKAMCMAMGDGFGADISMMNPGTYTIKTKVTADGKNLTDEFTYDLK